MYYLVGYAADQRNSCCLQTAMRSCANLHTASFRHLVRSSQTFFLIFVVFDELYDVFVKESVNETDLAIIVAECFKILNL